MTKKEPCEDCISRQAVIEHLDNIRKATDIENLYNEGFAHALSFCIITLELMPSVEPTRKKGKWVDYCGKFYCSECKAEYDEIYETYSHTHYSKFCPNCGADMKEGDDK